MTLVSRSISAGVLPAHSAGSSRSQSASRCPWTRKASRTPTSSAAATNVGAAIADELSAMSSPSPRSTLPAKSGSMTRMTARTSGASFFAVRPMPRFTASSPVTASTAAAVCTDAAVSTASIRASPKTTAWCARMSATRSSSALSEIATAGLPRPQSSPSTR
ncbi:MAG: hypothetical protein IT374_16985 [Polyangiaceae bacterium]|nr:hypothetical protein [Polyangiaceae bacterium]